ncbi:MAG: hydrogenase maturation protease [Tannerellaceae bacterium]|jgi:hydrogenase maturation protease|nr:hydrogenase maturation protease [Tannerellaceae bacterium]
MKTLVLGIGNLLLKDEGVGIHAIRALEKETLPPDIDLLDGGTGGLHLLGRLQEYDRIILVDATLDHHPPGAIRHIRPRYATDYPPLMSAHEIGLRDMIEAMILCGHHPEVDLLVVSAGDIGELGVELSPAVEASLPEIIRRIRLLIRN